MRFTGDSGVVLNAEFLDRSGGCVPRRRGYQDGRAGDDGGGQDPAGEADRPALSPDVSASCVPRIPGSCSAALLPGDIGCLGQFRSRRTQARPGWYAVNVVLTPAGFRHSRKCGDNTQRSGRMAP
jgi:hypothetical protein